MLPNVRRLAIALATSAVAACGGSPPAPPVVTPPPSAETINGSERIGWDQPAADTVELAAIRYAIYVDAARTEAAGVTCASTATAAGFACTARLPPLTSGAHTLQLASFVTDGGVLESARSAALQVNVAATTTAARAVPDSGGGSAKTSGERRAIQPGERPVQRIAEGFDDAIDLALAPDGRVFVAERAGTVRAVASAAGGSRDDRIGRADLRLPDLEALLAVAIDPQFGQTHFMFALYTVRDGAGGFTFAVARLRESGGTFGDAAVLLDRVPASSSPHAALRFGVDGRLYVALDASADPRRSDDLASFNGKVLRLNVDGTTPRDQRSATPVVASGLLAPAGLAWIAASPDPWAVDRRADGSAQLHEVGGSQRAYRLPDGIAPSSVVATRGGDLLIGAADTGALLHVRFDRADGRPLGTERITLAEIEGIRAMTLAPDGTVYLATATRLYRFADE